MRALHKMLAVQDDSALIALASQGLFRQARARFSKLGVVKKIEESSDCAVLNIEAQRVTIDSDGPGKARCDCSATGICRHILMAVLYLRDNIQQDKSLDEPSAYKEIVVLTIEEIEAFAGADWPQALRLAAASQDILPEGEGASCVVHLPDAPGAVTFVAGGGLRRAIFKGPDGWRKRFVAAAALVLCGHNIPIVKAAGAQVDPELLQQAGEAVRNGLQHGLRGDPQLAQDRFFDLALSARADAAPRLAALLRGAANHAGLLATRDPKSDPSAYLAELSECYAIIRALQHTPDDPLLTGQIRRSYLETEPFDISILGTGKWRTPSGARGLTIYGWDGERFLSSGPARAAGADPTFSPERAYDQQWWQGFTPSRMAGHILHLPAPRLSIDGVLPGQTKFLPNPPLLQLDNLPFHDDWQSMKADVAIRQVIGLRAATHTTPVLIRFASAGPVRFNQIEQRNYLEVFDKMGRCMALQIPDRECGQVIYEMQHKLKGALVKVVPEGDGLSFSLISLYFGTSLQVWNVTLDGIPKALGEGGVLNTLRTGARRLKLFTPSRSCPNRVTAFADQALQALGDGYCTPADTGKKTALIQKAEALGLSRIAQNLSEMESGDSIAVLELGWKLVLIRRAAQLH